MTMREFIKSYRGEIDEVIRKEYPNLRITDNEREVWVLDNDYLSSLAAYCGVKSCK